MSKRVIKIIISFYKNKQTKVMILSFSVIFSSYVVLFIWRFVVFWDWRQTTLPVNRLFQSACASPILSTFLISKSMAEVSRVQGTVLDPVAW